VCGAPTGLTDVETTSAAAHEHKARSKAWFVYAFVGIAQVATFAVLLRSVGVSTDDLGFPDFSSIPSLMVDTLLVAAPIIVLGLLAFESGEIDTRYLAAGVASSLVVAVRGGVILREVLQSAGQWSPDATVGLLKFLAILVVVFGILELARRGLIPIRAPRTLTLEQWPVVLAVVVVALLIAENPGRVLPDSSPALSIVTVVGLSVLALGEREVRQGAFAGIAFSIVATSGMVDSYYGSTSMYSTTSVSAVILCAVGVLDASLRKSRPPKS
jgi:hypothetical protein